MSVILNACAVAAAQESLEAVRSGLRNTSSSLVPALVACLGHSWPSPIPPFCAETWLTFCVLLTSLVFTSPLIRDDTG